MRLLDRYLLRELLLPLCYCLGGFLIFWVSFDLINEMGRFQKARLSLSEVSEYYLVTSPELLLVVMPVALLLALLYALTTHARYNELTAMRAAGISLWRLSLPYFGVGVFFSIAYLAINEGWVPKSVDRADEIMRRHDVQKTNAPDATWRRDLKFLNSRDNRSWWIKAYNLKSSEMQGVLIDWRLPDGTRNVISAQRGFYSDGIWKFTDVEELRSTNVQDIIANAVRTNQLEFTDWSESPALIRSELKINNRKQATKSPQLSIREILDYQELHPRLDQTTSSLLQTRLHERLAAPVACLVVVLIALPFGVLSGRRNVYVGVASSIFICFAYFILLKVGIALGTGGYVPGWLGAWLPNLLFATSAIALTMRIR